MDVASPFRFCQIAAVIAALSLLLFISQIAHAGLIEQDLFAQGDGLITLDTSTNTEYLDLSLTSDITSFAQLFSLLDNDPFYRGFRVASRDEGEALLNSGGLTFTSTNGSVVDEAAWQSAYQFNSLIDNRVREQPLDSARSGIINLTYNVQYEPFPGYYLSYFSSSYFCSTDWCGNTFTDNGTSVVPIGLLLVRSSELPEPNSLLLFSAILIIFLGRYSQNRCLHR